MRLLLFVAIIGALAADAGHVAEGQQPPPPSAPAQEQHEPAAQDKRGTDEVPLTVKVLPSPDHQTEAAEEKRRADEHAAAEQDLSDATWKLAYFTFALSVFAAGQVALFWWQLRLIRGEANQARLTRENVKAIERAYISGGGGPSYIKQTGAIARAMAEDGMPTLTVPTGNFQLQVNNHGKTPGELVEYGIGFCDAADIPPHPNYTRYHFQGWIAPGTNGLPIAEMPFPDGLTRCVVYGRFYYRDIFGDQHSAGFILQMPEGVSIVAPEEYTKTE